MHEERNLSRFYLAPSRRSIYSPTPTPLFVFLLSLTRSVQISFSPQPSAAIKIKAGGHNFLWKNTEHPLTKIVKKH